MVRDEGVCVRHWDWSETSQTVSVFTREHGLVRGLAKGAKRQESRFSGGLELLTRGELIASTRPGRDLATLTAWDLRESFPGPRRSLRAFYCGMYMADLTQHVVSEGDAHPALYAALVGALRELEQAHRAAAGLLSFQWAALSETGHRPEMTDDVAVGGALASARSFGFSPRLGGLTIDRKAGTSEPASPEVPGPLWRVRADTVELLRSIGDGHGHSTLSAAPAVIDRANRLLAAYFRELLGREPASMAAAVGSHPTDDRPEAATR